MVVVTSEKDLKHDLIKQPMVFQVSSLCPLRAAGTDPSAAVCVTHTSAACAPCKMQEFINHGGILYKVYVLGDMIEVCTVVPARIETNKPCNHACQAESEPHHHSPKLIVTPGV